jgi:diguanylate cyclase (GGDEF)-like protein
VLAVNRFKSFNDARGHVAGDGMLRRIGAELRAGLRATDTIARIGGDEFAVLFPETTQPQAQAALSHAIASLQDVHPPGLSYGVIEYHDGAPTVTDLLAGGDLVVSPVSSSWVRRRWR